MFTGRKQTIHEENSLDPEPSQDRPRNVIVFGECGVGKSSLINLLAGEKVCDTSSGALGCTLEYTQHSIFLGSERFAIWDTAGLDEGSYGAVPAEKAEAYLKQLLHGLSNTGGIDLLVYCVRGTRIRSALLMNYHIFYSAICRKKVPIAIVITGLENQDGVMESWWHNNRKEFSNLKMSFDGHACVTTLSESPSIEKTLLQERRAESKKAVTEMVINTCRAQRWRPPERSWFDSAYSDVRAMLFPKDGPARLATIIMCEVSRDPPTRSLRKRAISFHNPVAFSHRQVSFRKPVTFSSDIDRFPFEDSLKRTPQRVYRVYQVPRKHVSTDSTDEGTKKVIVIKRGADLLVFCVVMNETDDATVKSQWEHFNFTYGGDLSPQIVVVVGASDQQSAERWWKTTVGETQTKNDVCVAHCSMEEAAGTEVDIMRAQLQCLINDRCIDCCLRTMLARNETLFRRSLLLDLSSLTTLWTKAEGTGKEDGSQSGSEQDILTQWEVWDPVPETYPGPASSISPKEPQGVL